MAWRFLRPRLPRQPLVPVLLPEPLGSEVDALVAQGRQVEAVRRVRRRTDLGLLPAHLAVEHRRSTTPCALRLHPDL